MISSIPTSGAKKPNQPGYQGREMDDKARKERGDKQRKIDLLKRDILSEKANLRAEQNTHDALVREIAKLEGQFKSVAAIRPSSASGYQIAERQGAAKIAEDERKIKALEQESTGVDQAVESKMATLITQKEQEEEQDAKRIIGIREEIKRKNLELKAAEDEDRKLQQEIVSLKKSGPRKNNQDVQKKNEKAAQIEALKREISALNQGLNAKRLQSEVEGKSLVENQKRTIQEKTQAVIVAANRIKAIEQNIKSLESRIHALEI